MLVLIGGHHTWLPNMQEPCPQFIKLPDCCMPMCGKLPHVVFPRVQDNSLKNGH